MNKDELRGKAANIKGRAKEAAGALSGSKKTQAEGLAERFEGAVRAKIGKLKGDVKRGAESSPHHKNSHDAE